MISTILCLLSDFKKYIGPLKDKQQNKGKYFCVHLEDH
jgi:hypothetical protein